MLRGSGRSERAECYVLYKPAKHVMHSGRRRPLAASIESDPKGEERNARVGISVPFGDD